MRLASISLAAVHAAAFFLFLAYFSEANQRDGQAMLLWGYWLVIDFPVSLLVPAGWWVMDADAAVTRYWLYFVHGVLGTVWWYWIPAIAVRVFRRKQAGHA